jgi:hypothetical protein
MNEKQTPATERLRRRRERASLMGQMVQHALVVAVTFLFALNVGAEEARLFAVTKIKLAGPKGALRLTQVLFIPTELGETDCRELLRGAKEADHEGKIYEQSCVAELPADLEALRESRPVEKGYAAMYSRTFFPLSPIKVADVYVYEFDPGSPTAVCDRLLAQYKRSDKAALCLPPRE